MLFTWQRTQEYYKGKHLLTSLMVKNLLSIVLMYQIVSQHPRKNVLSRKTNCEMGHLEEKIRQFAIEIKRSEEVDSSEWPFFLCKSIQVQKWEVKEFFRLLLIGEPFFRSWLKACYNYQRRRDEPLMHQASRKSVPGERDRRGRGLRDRAVFCVVNCRKWQKGNVLKAQNAVRRTSWRSYRYLASFSCQIRRFVVICDLTFVIFSSHFTAHRQVWPFQVSDYLKQCMQLNLWISCQVNFGILLMFPKLKLFEFTLYVEGNAKKGLKF